MKRLFPSKTALGYAGLLAACFLLAMTGWALFANYIDSYAYDFLFNRNPPAPMRSQAMIVAIDNRTFESQGGTPRIRGILADALERIAAGQPKVVATDVILHDRTDAREDRRLADAMAKVKTLVLATDLTPAGWEDPLPEFARSAAALGSVSADELSPDGVTRFVALANRGDRKLRWELAMEAFRLAKGAPRILESPDALQIGDVVIPARYARDWSLRVSYSREGIPEIPVADLVEHPELSARLKDKVVFVGVTSTLVTRDRVVTPYGGGIISGLELNAETFKTLERGRFLTDASDLSVIGVSVLVAVLAGCIFGFLAGWPAYLAGVVLLAAAHLTPVLLFRQGIVFSFFAPWATAWLACTGAATYQHFVVRRQLWRSEVERARYRQAIHFVTHEMRSPLTAIQGSSELMGRYNLNEEKRKQIAAMINSESKRLARMIQTFLDVERLADGQMELKREPFAAGQMVQACLERVRPLAERKNIRMLVEEPLDGDLIGDHELMEYAVYNLLTNAVKYSPADTEVSVSRRLDAGLFRLSIEDQGMGMDSQELKQIFTRFYRTRRAEASGEAGTGIGLSIVDQIVKHHGGRVEVASTPGKGSRFTVILPASVHVEQASWQVSANQKGN